MAKRKLAFRSQTPCISFGIRLSSSTFETLLLLSWHHHRPRCDAARVPAPRPDSAKGPWACRIVVWCMRSFVHTYAVAVLWKCSAWSWSGSAATSFSSSTTTTTTIMVSSESRHQTTWPWIQGYTLGYGMVAKKCLCSSFRWGTLLVPMAASAASSSSLVSLDGHEGGPSARGTRFMCDSL